MNRKVCVVQRTFSWGEDGAPEVAFESLEQASVYVGVEVANLERRERNIWVTKTSRPPHYIITEVELIGHSDNT